ncbi:hypothetical protein ACLKA7_015212 [Drosophila subpalustris]
MFAEFQLLTNCKSAGDARKRKEARRRTGSKADRRQEDPTSMNTDRQDKDGDDFDGDDDADADELNNCRRQDRGQRRILMESLTVGRRTRILIICTKVMNSPVHNNNGSDDDDNEHLSEAIRCRVLRIVETMNFRVLRAVLQSFAMSFEWFARPYANYYCMVGVSDSDSDSGHITGGRISSKLIRKLLRILNGQMAKDLALAAPGPAIGNGASTNQCQACN